MVNEAVPYVTVLRVCKVEAQAPSPNHGALVILSQRWRISDGHPGHRDGGLCYGYLPVTRSRQACLGASVGMESAHGLLR